MLRSWVDERNHNLQARTRQADPGPIYPRGEIGVQNPKVVKLRQKEESFSAGEGSGNFLEPALVHTIKQGFRASFPKLRAKKEVHL